MAEELLKKVEVEVEEKGLKLSITEGEKEGKSKVITSCNYVEERFQECRMKEGVALETSVETLGVDLRARTKAVGAREKARRKKCDVRFSHIRKSRIFRKSYMRTGVRKLLRKGLVPARAWGGQAVGLAPRQRLTLRRQMAAAAGEKESVSLSFFMEVSNLEVEEEPFTMAALAWVEGVWLGRWVREQQKA